MRIVVPMRAGGVWLVLAAAILWGTTGTTQAFAPDGADPVAVGTLRLIVGGAGLLATAWVRNAFVRGRPWPFWATAAAITGVAAYQLCFFAGVDRTGVAVGTMVAIGSAPIMAGLLGFLVRGEALTRRWMMATGLAVAGCGLLVLFGGDAPGSETSGIDALGVLLALGAGGSYAVYAVASKQVLDHQAPEASMAVIFCGGALLLTPLLFTVNLEWAVQAGGVLVILHLGLIATTLSYVLFARGLKEVPAGTAVTLSLAEPLTASLLGVIVLGEQLTLPAVAGIALLFSGLYLLSRKPVDYD